MPRRKTSYPRDFSGTGPSPRAGQGENRKIWRSVRADQRDIRNWLRRADGDNGQGTEAGAGEDGELRRLRHENRQLRQERDILEAHPVS